MARKHTVRSPGSSHRHQPRLASTRTLPYRGGQAYLTTSIDPRLDLQQFDPTNDQSFASQTFLRDKSLTPCPSSIGPPTPESSLSPEPVPQFISPCLTNASLAVEYQTFNTSFLPTPESEDDFALVNFSGGINEECSDQPSQTPYNSWQEQDVDTEDHPSFVSPKSSLTGIHTSPESDRFLHPWEFVGPNGPSPCQLQRYPQVPGPWTPYPMRQDDAMDVDADSPLSFRSALSPTTSSNSEKKSRRNGPLSQEQRRSANKVRDLGSCLRCSLMKEKCSEGHPCTNCQNKRGRKWKLPCIRQRLNERVGVLFPPPIERRYGHDETYKHINSLACWYQYDMPEFTIQVEMGFKAPPLSVTVKEVEPTKHERLLQTFQVDRKTGDLGTSGIWDAPLLPYFRDTDAFKEDMLTQIRAIMQHVFQQKNATGLYWPYEAFGARGDWAGQVAEFTNEFQAGARHTAYFAPIYKAHRLLFLSCLFDRTFLIVGHEKDRVLSKLLNRPSPALLVGADGEPAKYICSEALQRIIRAIIYPYFKECAIDCLTVLHDTLLNLADPKDKSAPPSLAARDLAFSLAFILLVAVAQMQSRLLMLTSMSSREAGIDLGLDEAEGYIETMEEQLVGYVVLFHEFAVKKRARGARSSISASSSSSPGGVAMSSAEMDMRAAEQHSERFRLLEKVRNVTKGVAGDDRPTSTEHPPLHSLKAFQKPNAHRLCWWLIESGVEIPAGSR